MLTTLCTLYEPAMAESSMEQIPLTLDEVYTVSDLNSEVKWLLDTQFGSVWVEGEISNLMRARTGHMYFSLKDNRSQLRCAMFRNDNRRVQFSPADGQKVLVRGRLCPATTV